MKKLLFFLLLPSFAFSQFWKQVGNDLVPTNKGYALNLQQGLSNNGLRFGNSTRTDSGWVRYYNGSLWFRNATTWTKLVDGSSWIPATAGVSGYMSADTQTVSGTKRLDSISVTKGASFGGRINLKNYTVGTLPTGTRGDVCYVTDAILPTYLGVLTGGGAVVTPVFYDGSAWRSY